MYGFPPFSRLRYELLTVLVSGCQHVIPHSLVLSALPLGLVRASRHTHHLPRTATASLTSLRLPHIRRHFRRLPAPWPIPYPRLLSSTDTSRPESGTTNGKDRRMGPSPNKCISTFELGLFSGLTVYKYTTGVK